MPEKRRGEVRKKIWKNTEETGFRVSPDGILHCEEPAVSFFEENPKNLLAALKGRSGRIVAADLWSLCGFRFGPLQGCFRLCYTGAGADV